MASIVSTRTDEQLGAQPGELSDLGYGRVVAEQQHGRFLTHDGVSRSHKYGMGAQYPERFYLSALRVGWLTFGAWLVGIVLLINGIFALGYIAIGPGALQGGDTAALQDRFLRALSFSVGVFTTNGTGAMYPVGTTAHWLMLVESIVGPFTLLAAGGLIVGRLTRPRMRLRFSETAVVAPYEQGRGLMFRLVNVQPGELSDVRVTVTLVRFEDTVDGRHRRFYPLALERKSVEFFPLHWTVVHPIRAGSPLAGVTPEIMRAAQAELLVLVSAHEETFSTRVTARSSYLWDEVRWDASFASIFTSAPDGAIAIDVERLDRTERLPEGTTSTPAALELEGSRL